MEYTGLATRYAVNRLLNGSEQQLHLRQSERLDVAPAYQLSVIRFGSDCLDLVDKYFAWKGVLTTTSLVGLLLFSGFMLMSIWDSLAMTSVGAQLAAARGATWRDVVFDALFLLAAVLPMLWLLGKESFAYTHYPIRLNRKTRMVHVFRLDGSVLSVPWDEVFFCMGRLKQGFWEIQGHVLDKDGVTVRETFALPDLAGSEREREQMKRYWE